MSSREKSVAPEYRGRLAPSPTGFLHLGHARTFWVAQQRAQAKHGTLVLRNEDLDRARCRAEFVEAMLEDLSWVGLEWDEGPDIGGAHGPYNQNERTSHYLAAFEALRATGMIYPCKCSRKEVARALSAPQGGDDEPIYPGTCRERASLAATTPRAGVNWRFHVPDTRRVAFLDTGFGAQSFTAGTDFGDFLVWRKDDQPSYQLAVVVDDAAMRISEVVRGADLLLSTARQLLLYEALHLTPPSFHHCFLITDKRGIRLAKRDDSLALRKLRADGRLPEELRAEEVRSKK
ncbi:MAG TPA: tRNA glutamyl-Q(34) synthetase GluQRS [Chthoniobacteraceae bacterium]|nr:tRNA glutamyl-Q(34) synthetase GluQRS [Chthoniobacteraceae bacterium]